MPRSKTISDEDVLAVARLNFQRHGHSVSTRIIAKETGLSQATLFQRFGSKRDMFLRAMMPPPPDIEALLCRPEGCSARAYVLIVLERLVEHFRSLMPSFMLLMTYPDFDPSLVSGAHEHLLAHRLEQELAARLREMEQGGELASHPPEAMAATVIGLAHTLGMHSSLHEQEATPLPGFGKESLEAILEVIWAGMGSREASQ